MWNGLKALNLKQRIVKTELKVVKSLTENHLDKVEGTDVHIPIKMDIFVVVLRTFDMEIDGAPSLALYRHTVQLIYILSICKK